MRVHHIARSARALSRAAWLAALVPAFAAGAAAQSKPLLSKEIHAVFEERGAAAATRRYEEIAARHADAYSFDTQGLMQIAATYAQGGNMAASQLFLEIGQKVMQRELRGSSMMQELDTMLARAAREDSANRKVNAAQQAAAAPVRDADTGPARADLERFFGVYGDPDAKIARNVFVSQHCEKRLVFGAMWGDVAPWLMRSEGDATFVQIWHAVSEEPLRVQFHLSDNGRAVALTHTLTAGNRPVRVVRLRELPDEWKEICPQR